MGLSHSKAHPRVTKVTPLQNKEEEEPPEIPVDLTFNQSLGERSCYSLDGLQYQRKALEGQLPPLRETWYGRYSAVPRAMYFDIPLERGEASIIKRHPPRRLQKLEPLDLPQVITSGRLLTQQEAEGTHKTKGLEKKMQIPMYVPRNRQYLHKMQMLEMNRKRQEAQMELGKLQEEAKINKEKLKDHKARTPRNDNSGDFLTLPDETLNRSPGNSQNEDFGDRQPRNDYYSRKIGKMETWLREQEARGQLLWDSSSSDSDEPGNKERRPCALVRTRTEKIPLFDEFFDRE